MPGRIETQLSRLCKSILKNATVQYINSTSQKHSLR